MTFLTGGVRNCALALAVVGVALSVPLESAKAGFFDFLFQPQLFAPEAYAPRPRRHPHSASDFSRRHRLAIKRHAAKVRHAGRPVALLHPKWEEKDPCCKVAGAARPAPVLLDDDSLREGDAVMTHSGLKVFMGDSGPHHRLEDFAPLSDAKSLPRRVRKILLELDPRGSGNEPRRAQLELTTGRSAAAATMATGSMIVDPRGNRIRYVGP